MVAQSADAASSHRQGGADRDETAPTLPTLGLKEESSWLIIENGK